MDKLGRYLAAFTHFSRNAKLYLAVQFLSSVTFGINGVLFNLYLLSHGLAETLLGDVIFVASVAGLLTALPAGWASDRCGRRPLLVLGLAVGALALMGQALYPTPGLVLLLSAVGAAGGMMAQAVGAPLMTEASTDADRNHLFSLSQALSTVANVAGSLMGGSLPALLAARGLPVVGAQRWTLLAAAAVAAAALVPALLLRPEATPAGPASARTARTGGGAAPGATATRPPFRTVPLTVAALLFSQALVGTGAGLFVPFYNVFLTRHLGATVEQVGVIFSAQSLGIALALMAAPWLAQRLGTIRSVAVLQGASLPFLGIMALVPSLPVVAVAGVLRATLMNAANPGFAAYSMEVVPAHRRASVNSLNMAAWSGGWALGAKLAGNLMQSSYTAPYFVTLGLYAGAVLFIYLAFVPGRQPDPNAYSG